MTLEAARWLLLQQPLWLAALLAVWGIAGWRGVFRVAEVARISAVLLAFQWLVMCWLMALVIFTLHWVLFFYARGHDPGTFIASVQYVALPVGWGSVYLAWRAVPAHPQSIARPTAADFKWALGKLVLGIPLFLFGSCALMTICAVTFWGIFADVGPALVLIAPSSVALLYVIHGWMRRPGAASDVWSRVRARFQGPRFAAAALLLAPVGVALTFAALNVPVRTLYRLPVWAFDATTATLASNECLTLRVAEYGTSEQRGAAGPSLENLSIQLASAPADTASRVLMWRGPGALPGVIRGLDVIWRDGSASERGNALSVLAHAATWPGSDALLERWSEGGTPSWVQARIKSWLDCIRRGQRDRIPKNSTGYCWPSAANN